MITRIGAVYIDRSPDFFALNRARGDTRTIVAELEGKPVGYACYAVRETRVAGRPRRVASAHDFRVDPTLRRRKVGSKIVAELFRRVAEDGCHYIYGMVAMGNRQATPFSMGGPGWPRLPTGGRFFNFSLRPFRRPPRKRYRIEPAREEDIPEIVEIINAQYGDHNFAPCYTPETFSAMLLSSVGYDIENLTVARDGGRIVAVLGVWKQSRAKAIILLKLHPVLSLLFKLTSLIFRLLRIPMNIPRTGEAMSSLYVRHAAAREGRRRAFRDLVRWVTARIRRESGRSPIIFTGAHERDLRFWRGSMIGRGSKFTLYYNPFRDVTDGEEEALSSRPFYDDFSLS